MTLIYFISQKNGEIYTVRLRMCGILTVKWPTRMCENLRRWSGHRIFRKSNTAQLLVEANHSGVSNYLAWVEIEYLERVHIRCS